MTTFVCTYQDFYRSAGEFFKLAAQPETTHDEVMNGEKALGLMYLGVDKMSSMEQTQAVTILGMVRKKAEEFDPDPIVQRGLAAMKRLKEYVS